MGCRYIDCAAIEKVFDHINVVSVGNFEDMGRELERARDKNELSLIEIKCSIEAWKNLGGQLFRRLKTNADS